MRLRRRLRTLALLAGLAAAASANPRPATAQDAGPTSSANVAAARRHFDKARTDYAQGSYREAIAELEAAHALDPSAKDLVFNLGVVHEKLSDIDDALQWFQLYTTMTLTLQERDRADAYIRRLEGAKKELAQHPPEPSPSGSPGTPPPTESALLPIGPPPPAPRRRGRIDGATIAAVSVTGAALVFATVMSVKAKVDEPPTPFVTGRDGTYSELQSRTDTAHREAIFADAGFGLAIAAGITAAVLYFARTGDSSAPAPAPVTVSPTPLTGGGGLIVQGSF
jgi:tetratricopeptide (TPR) repeat protein